MSKADNSYTHPTQPLFNRQSLPESPNPSAVGSFFPSAYFLVTSFLSDHFQRTKPADESLRWLLWQSGDRKSFEGCLWSASQNSSSNCCLIFETCLITPESCEVDDGFISRLRTRKLGLMGEITSPVSGGAGAASAHGLRPKFAFSAAHPTSLCLPLPLVQSPGATPHLLGASAGRLPGLRPVLGCERSRRGGAVL